MYLWLWFWIRMPKPKREEAGLFSKSERQMLPRLFTPGGAAWGSVRNLVKASNLSVSKVRHFLQSKPSYTKFTPAKSNFKRVKSFARFKKEIWYMDLVYVDKLAKNNNGVMYLLVRQDLFDRTVDSKRMKIKGSKKTVRAFLAMITKKWPKKIWVDKGTEFAGEFKKLQNWRITYLLYNEWNQGGTCWMYNRIPETYILPLQGSQWIQIHSQIDSICYNTNFWKKMFNRLDTIECKEFRLFLHSVQQTTTRI